MRRDKLQLTSFVVSVRMQLQHSSSMRLPNQLLMLQQLLTCRRLPWRACLVWSMHEAMRKSRKSLLPLPLLRILQLLPLESRRLLIS